MDLISPAVVNETLAVIDFSKPEDAELGDAVLWTVGFFAIQIMHNQTRFDKIITRRGAREASRKAERP